jgi:hypothetical protein
MKVTIEIDCSDEDEIYTHLSVIKSQIKKKIKTLDPDAKWEPFTVEDNNCYGHHKAEVTDDFPGFNTTL